jgi:glycogen debranching enzyme
MKNKMGASARPVTMEEAVGYPALTCEAQTPAEHPLVLKHGRYFLITNCHGDITPPGHCSLGLFEDDTRLLSHYSLKICGGPPALLSVQSPHSYLGQIDLTITDGDFGGNSWDPKNCVHIRRELLVSDRMVERITLTSYLPTSIDYWMELAIGCDFADIFEIRGWKREKRGQFYASQKTRKSLSFRYQGLDGALVRSTVQFRQAPTSISNKGARWELKLVPRSPYRIEWEISGEEPNGQSSWEGWGLEERQKQMDEAYAR